MKRIHFHPDDLLTPEEQQMLQPMFWPIVLIGTLTLALAVAMTLCATLK